MTIEQIREEIYYYVRERATTEEAEEIRDIMKSNPHASFDEIVAEYYGLSI